MKKIAFFGAKPYDQEAFDAANNRRYEIRYCCRDGKTMMPKDCAKRLTGRCSHQHC